MNSDLENSAMSGDARDSNDEAARSPAARPDVPAQTPAPRRSLVGAAASFAGSMAKFVAGGFKMVEPPLHDLRTSHCQPCQYRVDSQCSLCRCFIDKKAWLPHEDCPIGRWQS